jgi:NAD(P)-dependent dehydrogenase (short-subunit alcohol dehydrogenase family)
MKSLAGKVVVITGAGSGIGRALAHRFAREGALLALSDQDLASVEETASRLRGARRVEVARLDVRDSDAIAAYAERVAASFGAVNVLVNNAGVALHGDFSDVTAEQFQRVIDVNFWGVIHGTRAFLPHLIASGEGHVVNLSSVFGLVGVPGQTAYNCTKFAVRGFSEALRQEMLIAGHPVDVTAVHPGGIQTDIARAAEVADGIDRKAVVGFFDGTLARTSADRAAELIVRGVRRSKPRVVVGADAHLLHLASRVFGARYQRPLALVAKRALDKAAAS